MHVSVVMNVELNNRKLHFIIQGATYTSVQSISSGTFYSGQ